MKDIPSEPVENEVINVFNKTCYGITFCSLKAVKWFVDTIIDEHIRAVLDSELKGLRCCGNCIHSYISVDELDCRKKSGDTVQREDVCDEWEKYVYRE